jgi:hypothetical protein
MDPPQAHTQGVRIVLELISADDGRLSGTAQAVASDVVLPFSGVLELVARVEELSRNEPARSGRAGTSPDHQSEVTSPGEPGAERGGATC